jgi:hypothetical protein
VQIKFKQIKEKGMIHAAMIDKKIHPFLLIVLAELQKS